MASISISSNQQSIGFVRVRNGYSQEVCEYPLYPALSISSNIILASEEPVIENAQYSISVVFPAQYPIEDIELSVNGSDVCHCEPNRSAEELIDGDTFISYPVDTSSMTNSKLPFLLTYGFVRMEVVATLGEEERNYSTKDIPCLSSDQFQSVSIKEMLSSLLDDDQGPVSRWMFTDGHDNESEFALLDGGLQYNSKKSLSSMIQLLESIALEYDLRFPYFHSHGYSRITSRPVKMSPRNIRHIGSQEVLWISKNLEVLSETPTESNIDYLGRYYVPREVESRRKVKTYDSYENSLVLGFLNDAVAKTKAILSELRAGISYAEALKDRLGTIRRENYSLPALVLVQQCTMREEFFINKLSMILAKLRQLVRKYEAALPGVAPRFPKNPKRTKVFQEIDAYSGLYALMSKWLTFGDFTLARESLALHSLRLDKLYEYYSLYRLLKWFDENGFTEDSSLEKPIYRAEYSLVAPHYHNERRVATYYALTKDSIKIHLYYQPVIYGDEREENGISLHRLSPRNPLSKKLKDGFWTPDFLLNVISSPGETSWHIFDSKYSRPEKLWEGYPKTGSFSQQISKYKSDIGGTSSTDRISSVWLLSGRSNYAHIQYAETSSWARESYHAAKSGIVSLSPRFSKIDSVFSDVVSLPIKSKEGKRNQTPIEGQDEEFPQVQALPVDSKSRSRNKEPWFAKPGNRCLPLIVELYGLVDNPEDLFKSKWAERNLGIAHPLLRSMQPNGVERKYYESGNINGISCYIFKQWLPHQENKLKSLVEKKRDSNKKLDPESVNELV